MSWLSRLFGGKPATERKAQRLNYLDEALVLDHGRLRFVGKPEEFRASQDPLVRAFADRQAAAAAALAIMEEP